MKIKAIERMVKAEKTLVIKTATDGDVWVGTGSAMYNIGAVGTSPVQTVRWLFGIEEIELEKYDVDSGDFDIPKDDDDETIPEDSVIGLTIEDTLGNAVTPHVFGGVVYTLGCDELAPLKNERSPAYRYDASAGRIIVMRGMFAVASIDVRPARADAAYFDRLRETVQLIDAQSKV